MGGVNYFRKKQKATPELQHSLSKEVKHERSYPEHLPQKMPGVRGFRFQVFPGRVDIQAFMSVLSPSLYTVTLLFLFFFLLSFSCPDQLHSRFISKLGKRPACQFPNLLIILDATPHQTKETCWAKALEQFLEHLLTVGV